MPKRLMGFEGKIFTGTAGSEATDEITNSRDIKYSFDYDKGDTTERGEDESVPPIEYGRVSVRKITITFNTTNKEDDALLATLLAASYAGQPVAIRTKDKAAGKGFDGDCIIKHELGKPLRGEQTYDFTCEPNNDLREAELYV